MKRQPLATRIEAYEKSARGARRHSVARNWPAFAAAAGSALAMASNASANSIVTGAIGGTLADVAGSHATFAGVGPAGDALQAGIFQGLISIQHTHTATHTTTFGPGGGGGHPGSSSSGFPGSGGTPNVHTHIHSHTHHVSGLLLGLNIVGGSGGNFAFDSANLGTVGRPVTPANFVPQVVKIFPGTGDVFGAAEWKVGGQNYLGWILVDFHASSVDLVSWAYNSIAGQTILTGQTSNDSIPPTTTPEPSTAAMALLAAGAAGVLAWRKRRSAVPAE